MRVHPEVSGLSR